MVDVNNAGAAFGCSSVSLPSDRLGRYLHLVLFENSQDLFGPNFPELADLDDACLALFSDTLGGCRELDDEHFQAIEALRRSSEERREGKEGDSKCRSRWWRVIEKKN